MGQPSRRRSRRIGAGVIAGALVVGGGGFLLGRVTSPRPVHRASVAPAPVLAPAPAPAPVATPAVTPPLGRADLLDAARQAADAFAAARPLPSPVAALDGRRFAIAIPFGCAGPAAPDATLGWTYDEDAGALRVFAAPARLDPAEWLGPAADDVEAIEGFWVERPWSSLETCPARPELASAGTEHSFGLAQFFRADQSRVGRRDGKPLVVTVVTPPDAVRPGQGLRLRLSGRVAAAPGGNGPFSCHAPGIAGGRPVCLLAASFDTVSVENPATGETAATWPLAGGPATAD